jgi:hypothetical protein
MDIMDKTDAFFEALQEAGIEFGLGQTAVVCKDGVVLISVDEDDGVNTIICNRKIDFDYELGITSDDINQFNTVTGLMEEIAGDD